MPPPIAVKKATLRLALLLLGIALAVGWWTDWQPISASFSSTIPRDDVTVEVSAEEISACARLFASTPDAAHDTSVEGLRLYKRQLLEKLADASSENLLLAERLCLSPNTDTFNKHLSDIRGALESTSTALRNIHQHTLNTRSSSRFDGHYGPDREHMLTYLGHQDQRLEELAQVRSMVDSAINLLYFIRGNHFSADSYLANLARVVAPWNAGVDGH